MESKFIVAEVSKNWKWGEGSAELLSQKFELVINTNLERGYKLIDWKISTVVHQDVLNETIIAIFEKDPSSTDKT